MQILWPCRSEPPPLEADEAHVWAVPFDELMIRWDDCRTVLSIDEQERADEFRFDAPRRRFAVSRVALRTLLGMYLGERPQSVDFHVRADGKPQLVGGADDQALQFNLSHSGELALIVVARGCEVGVDVEQFREVRYLEQIARRYFHADEVQEVLAAETADRVQAFLRCWTAKEAVLKAVGTGITGRLDSFRVPTTTDEPTWVELHSAAIFAATGCWLKPLSPCDAYMGAVATLDVERRARCYTLIV